METLTLLKPLLSTALEIDTSQFQVTTLLLGDIPEFDSMAIMKIIVDIETAFGFEMQEEDLNAELFESMESLIDYIESRIEITV